MRAHQQFFKLVFISAVAGFSVLVTPAFAKTCDSIFVSIPIDLLAKSNLQIDDITLTSVHHPDKRFGIELRKNDGSMIGRMSLWPSGTRFFHVGIVLLNQGYEGKGLGFFMYAAATQIAAEKYGRIVSASRIRHSQEAETLWQKMVNSGAARVRYLPLFELAGYLNELSPIQPIPPIEVANYIERFGQSIYTMQNDINVARYVSRVNSERGTEIHEDSELHVAEKF